jgi:hypothetical protein
MKPVFRLFFTLFLTVFTFAPSVAMDPSYAYPDLVSPLKPGEYKLRFSPKDSPMQEIVAAINETPQGGLIAMNGSFINHPGLVEALAHAQARGVRLELCVDARKSENKILLENLNHDCLHATCGLHTKRCIIYDVDPKGDLEVARNARGAQLFTGSENLSGNVGTHHEYTFTTRLPELVKKHYKDHLRNKEVCGAYTQEESDKKEFHRVKINSDKKKNVELSPRVVRVYNSQKYDSGKLKAARIAKPVPADATECIYISSMSFDDERVANALHNKAVAGTEVQLIVDKSAVKNEKGLRLLNQLHQVGAKIYVWEGSSIQHTKLLLRERRNKLDGHCLDSLSVLSTGNLVKNSSTEINYDQIVPESHAVSQDIRGCFAKLVKVCTPFEKIDQQAIALKKANKGKDVVTLACGTCKEQIGAPAEKTLIRKYIKHCKKEHEGRLANTLAVENVKPRALYCALCSECAEPFYNNTSVAAATLSIAKHRVKDHAVGKDLAQQQRKNTLVAHAEFSIAQNNDLK